VPLKINHRIACGGAEVSVDFQSGAAAVEQLLQDADRGKRVTATKERVVCHRVFLLERSPTRLPGRRLA
jgi:hypothetical protein